MSCVEKYVSIKWTLLNKISTLFITWNTQNSLPKRTKETCTNQHHEQQRRCTYLSEMSCVGKHVSIRWTLLNINVIDTPLSTWNTQNSTSQNAPRKDKPTST